MDLDNTAFKFGLLPMALSAIKGKDRSNPAPDAPKDKPKRRSLPARDTILGGVAPGGLLGAMRRDGNKTYG